MPPADSGKELSEEQTALIRRWIEQGFAPLRTAWLERAVGLGGPIVAGGLAGRFAGLDPDGGLILIDQAGTTHVVTAGEVHLGEPACC